MKTAHQKRIEKAREACRIAGRHMWNADDEDDAGAAAFYLRKALESLPAAPPPAEHEPCGVVVIKPDHPSERLHDGTEGFRSRWRR